MKKVKIEMGEPNNEERTKIEVPENPYLHPAYDMENFMQHGLVASQKRLFIATMAMNGIMSNPTIDFKVNTPKMIVESAYTIADEMLKYEQTIP
jgi:hypothetical protein